LQAIKNCGLEYLRVEGYHASAASELGPQGQPASDRPARYHDRNKNGTKLTLPKLQILHSPG
jgi:hypothetical protein